MEYPTECGMQNCIGKLGYHYTVKKIKEQINQLQVGDHLDCYGLSSLQVSWHTNGFLAYTS